MTEQVKAHSINDHLGVIRKTDSKSQEFIGTLEQFKLSLQKMVDESSIEEEGIKLMELVYEQINFLRKKQDDFKFDIASLLSEEWFSTWKLNLSDEDIEKIKFNTFLSSKNWLNAIVSKIENIFKKLIKLKSCSIDSDEYTNLKDELSVMIFWDNNLVIWFYNRAEPKSRQLLLDEHTSDLIKAKLEIKKYLWRQKLLFKLWQEHDKASFLYWIIDMIEAVFKLENSDLIKNYYNNIYELKIYLWNLNIIRKIDNTEKPNYSEQIQSLVNEIATLITERLPEVESLITQKIEWRI